jgi:hypothetical protein
MNSIYVAERKNEGRKPDKTSSQRWLEFMSETSTKKCRSRIPFLDKSHLSSYSISSLLSEVSLSGRSTFGYINDMEIMGNSVYISQPEMEMSSLASAHERTYFT